MNKISWFSTSISRKLFILSLIPLIMVTSIITWHTIDTRRDEIELSLQQSTSLTVNTLASISDFAMYTGRLDLLKTLASSATRVPSISSVIYTDLNRNILFKHQAPDSLSPGDIKSRKFENLAPRYSAVEKPVYLTNTNVSDYEETEEATLLGWVIVIADKANIKKQEQDILLTHLFISFMVLIGAIILTFFSSKTVVLPIRRMTAAVKELEQGNLNIRLTPSTHDDLAILAKGINHLAFTVDEGRKNLEKKVLLATKQLQKSLVDLQQKNVELDTARQQAETASQAKSDFLAHMSHELRTPITAIQGFIKLLGESDLKPAEKRYCTITQQASSQLLQLIDDILDITRLQSSGIVIEPAAFNLIDCIEHPISLMAPTAHEKGVELITDIAPGLPLSLIGDSLRIRQIVFNLVSNAIKFTSTGYVLVNIDYVPQDNNEVILIIAVIDSGIGIPEKQKAQIFEPFTQGDNSISRHFGGSGLGLTIVSNLVSLMDGKVAIKSSRGKGSVFTVELPLPIAAIQPNFSSNYKSLLLFDTQPRSRQALEHVLSRFVTTIESAETFSELEHGEITLKPEIIIYSSPILQSADITRSHVEKLYASYSCPIVIISPLSLTTEIAANSNNDAFLYIDKPPSIRELSAIFTDDFSVFDAHNIFNNSLPATILVAEDNAFTQILLGMFLEKTGSHFVTVKNGQEAIDACKTQHFDLILMDVHMPEINGITAVKTIRMSSGSNQNTPIVMLTADILQQEESALFDAGANDLVFKPIDETKLFYTLKQYVKNPDIHLVEQPVTELPPSSVEKGLFVSEVSKLTQSTQDALNAADEKTLRDTIHQLLGIAGVFKMESLERAVSELHTAVKSHNQEKAYAAMETLILEVSMLKKHLSVPD